MVLDPNMPGVTRLEAVSGPVDLRGRTVGVSLPCPTCGYDLRGASATGMCAECGCSVAQLLASLIDPATHRLPRLADPRAVGDGIVLLALGLASSVVLPVVGVLWAGAASISGRSGVSVPVIETLITLALVLVAVLAGAGCWCLKPRHEGPLHAAAWRAVRMAAFGGLLQTLGLAALVIGQDWFVLGGLLVAGTGLLVGLGGVRQVLVEAGRRCRDFRTATFRRQRIPTLMLAGALATVALIGARLASMVVQGRGTMDLTLGAVGLIVTCVLAVGLIYLVSNAVWIRRDLRRPPPKLADLLDPEAA